MAELKSTAADLDKEMARWNLSWKPDGRSNDFTREAILAYAPPSSGVYGLFNFNCQVFIGESANIQEALLRHESQNFQSEHLRPTGFTFETCAAELRTSKAAELTARFRPVLQTEAALVEAALASNSSTASKPHLDSAVSETDGDPQESLVKEHEPRREGPRRFSFARPRGVRSAVLFGAVAVVAVYLGLFANKNIQGRADGASENRLTPVSNEQATNADRDETRPTPQNPSLSSRPSEIVKPNTAPTSAKTNASNSASVPDLDKKWSVQIAATPTKAAAEDLAQQLKGSGYDAYIVKAEVKGQTYYRVRLGRFSAREEAESARQSLAHQEGYSDAFLTSD